MLLLASCGTQENYQLGVGFLEETGRGVELLTVAAPSMTADYEVSVPTEFAGQIGVVLVGARPGFLVRGAFRFDETAFPASGTAVDSAFVELTVRQGFGARQSLEMDLHKITSTWDDGQAVFAFPGIEAAARATVDVPFTADTLDTLRISLTALVQEWVADSTSNFGFALVPTAGQDSEIEFAGRTSATPPRLLIYTNDGTNVALTELNPTSDSFLLETTPAHTPPVGFPERLTVARGLTSRVLMHFDLPDLGDRVTIHRAEVTVHVDPVASATNGFAAGFQRVTAEPWNGEDTEVDPLLTGLQNVSAASDSVSFAVTAIVQQLLKDGNFGVQFRPLEEREDTDILRIFGPGTALAPNLRVWYTRGGGQS